MFKKYNKKGGFTLLEILLVVGIISILTGIVIVAINPTKQLGDARNAQRRSDTIALLNAVSQYMIDHSGTYPTTLPTYSGAYTNPTASCALIAATTTYGICKGTATDCSGGGIDLKWHLASTTGSYYLTSIPIDPSTPTDYLVSGYFVGKFDGGRVLVCAPYTENGVTIISAVR